VCLRRIDCDEICPDPDRPADPFDQLEALAESIRLHGVLRPVLARATSNGYVIVHGVRRWRAARMIGLRQIPVLIVDDVLTVRKREIAATNG
jgi:ParB family chromosome partitioning protein